MLGRVQHTTTLSLPNQAGNDEIPNEELHDQRNVAKQLDVGIAAAHQPAFVGGAHYADDRAQGEGEIQAKKAVLSVSPGRCQHLPPARVPVRHLLEKIPRFILASLLLQWPRHLGLHKKSRTGGRRHPALMRRPRAYCTPCRSGS